MPDTTNLTPITYDAAMALYTANGRKPFSFIAAPYNVLKTITIQNGHVVASSPSAAYSHYEWLSINRRARGIR